MVIHCVKAFNELIELKKKYRPQMPWVVHGFRNNPVSYTHLDVYKRQLLGVWNSPKPIPQSAIRQMIFHSAGWGGSK